jgi:hypothetical protein
MHVSLELKHKSQAEYGTSEVKHKSQQDTSEVFHPYFLEHKQSMAPLPFSAIARHELRQSITHQTKVLI